MAPLEATEKFIENKAKRLTTGATPVNAVTNLKSEDMGNRLIDQVREQVCYLDVTHLKIKRKERRRCRPHFKHFSIILIA